MRGPLLDSALVIVATLAVVGFVRSLVVLESPAAADLPEPLRSVGPKLVGYRTLQQSTIPGKRERDVAWGPTHRYQLVPTKGAPLSLELVVRRGRDWKAMEWEQMAGSRSLQLGPRQHVRLGTVEKRQALQTCIVGRGNGEEEPTAIAKERDLESAVIRWRDRLDQPVSTNGRILRGIAIQAGLRVSERWECLWVTLKDEEQPQGSKGGSDARLLTTWKELFPTLRVWGETWSGVND